MTGSSANAAELFERAAAKLVGSTTPRDLPEARRLLARSAVLGNEDAALLDIALTANGSGSLPVWDVALDKLRALSRSSEVARAHMALLNAMALDGTGMPTRLPPTRRLSTKPDVWISQRLFTASECAHIATVASDLLRPSVVIDPSTGRQVAHPIRRSDSGTIGPAREDLVVAAVNRRIAAVTGTAVTQGEPLTILRYEKGGEYRLHHDALPNEDNQRVLTAIIYLNSAYLGGQTSLPSAGIHFRGEVGDMLFFRNCDDAGVLDLLARHCGMPVWTGTKLIATRWIRSQPLDPWTARRFN